MASWDEKLLTAARKGNKKEVESCVKNRANLECRSDDIWGRTPLMWAAVRGHLEVVMYLVSQGSQLEATSRAGMTPLLWAAQWGHLEVVTYLVSQGSQLETTDLVGETALHYAARNEHIDVTKYLIDQGCSPWVKTKQLKLMLGRIRATPEVNFDSLKTDEDNSFEKRNKFIKSKEQDFQRA